MAPRGLARLITVKSWGEGVCRKTGNFLQAISSEFGRSGSRPEELVLIKESKEQNQKRSKKKLSRVPRRKLGTSEKSSLNLQVKEEDVARSSKREKTAVIQKNGPARKILKLSSYVLWRDLTARGEPPGLE